MSELKPCPFCGGVPILRERLLIGYKELWYRVQCESCGAESCELRPADAAISRWNRRAADKAQEMTTVCIKCGERHNDFSSACNGTGVSA